VRAQQEAHAVLEQRPVERLAHEVGGAHLEGAVDGGLVGVARGDQDAELAGRPLAAQLRAGGEAVEVGHLDVEQDQVRVPPAHGLDRGPPVLGLLYHEAHRRQAAAREQADHRVVVDHQHAAGVGRDATHRGLRSARGRAPRGAGPAPRAPRRRDREAPRCGPLAPRPPAPWLSAASRSPPTCALLEARVWAARASAAASPAASASSSVASSRCDEAANAARISSRKPGSSARASSPSSTLGSRVGVAAGSAEAVRRARLGARVGGGGGRPLLEHAPELVAGEGLAQVVVHAHLEARLPVALHGVGGERDDRRAAGRRIGGLAGADLPRGAEAVHHRHLAVHEDQVEALLRERAHPLGAVRDGAHLAAQRLEQHHGHAAVDLVVLAQQHAARHVARRCGRRGGRRRRDRLAPQHGVERRAQVRAARGLVEAHRDRAVALLLGGERRAGGGEQDQPGLGQRGVAPDGAGHVHPGHARHHHVQHHQPVGRAGSVGAAQLVQRGGAVLALRRDAAPGCEVVEQDAPVGGVVVHHQDRHVAEVRLGRARRGVRRELHRDAEPEARAAPGLALEADLAAQELHELAADGEPEAGAAEAPGERPVRLRERLEDLALAALGDADPGVGDAELEPAALRVRAGARAAVVRQPRHAHRHLAALGELDRVADQVHQHLAHAHRVRAHLARHLVLDEAGQLEALALGLRRQQRRDVLHRFVQVEVGGLELELAGLRPREVEDVVDHAEQQPRRLVGRLTELSLVGREPGVEQQLGHAQHAVHGRADLVAHVGQELGLGAVGGLGLAGEVLGLLGAAAQLDRPLLHLRLEGALVLLDAVAVLAQPLEHHREPGAQLADLVAGGHRYVAVELAAGDVAGQRGEPADRPRRLPADRQRERRAGGDHQQRRQAAGGQQSAEARGRRRRPQAELDVAGDPGQPAARREGGRRGGVDPVDRHQHVQPGDAVRLAIADARRAGAHALPERRRRQRRAMRGRGELRAVGAEQTGEEQPRVVGRVGERARQGGAVPRQQGGPAVVADQRRDGEPALLGGPPLRAQRPTP
jgi:hypothetical protein